MHGFPLLLMHAGLEYFQVLRLSSSLGHYSDYILYNLEILTDSIGF